MRNVSSEQVFLGNGSDEIIDLCFRVFCEPGIDKALTFTPSYGMYKVSAEINNVELDEVNLNENFQIDLDKTLPYLEDPNLKLIFICSPNNPTGNLIDEASIAAICEKFKGIVIIDRAYGEFSGEYNISKVLNTWKNCIQTSTFSKAWGLAGARLGVAYASEEIINLLNKVKPPYNISTLNQDAAIESIRNSDEIKENVTNILNQREVLAKELQEIECVVKVFPSDANFLLVEVEDADYIYNSLVNQKIITRNRNKLIKNTIRISVGSPEENQQLLQNLASIKTTVNS